jgi:hypothetical protein
MIMMAFEIMDVILGLNKPFPIMKPNSIYKNKGVSTAIDALKSLPKHLAQQRRRTKNAKTPTGILHFDVL